MSAYPSFSVHLRGTAAGFIMGLTFVAASPARADFPVGKTVLTVAAPTELRGNASGRLRITVWYPAPVGTTVRTDGIGPPANPFFLAGRVARDAPVASAPGRFPLIALSHGTGGAAMQMAWLGTRLAAHGYIAAAVDHPGNNYVSGYTASGFLLWWLRARDMSRTIDGVLADARFAASVDRSRIGAAGFSLGGYTVLEVAGARTSLERFTDYCDRTHLVICGGPPEFPNAEAQMRKLLARSVALRKELERAGASYRDPRVRAVFAIAPAVVPALVPESLRGISLPVFIVAGLGDPEVAVADNAFPAASLIPNASLHLFPHDVGHYTFLDLCTPAGRKRFAKLCVNSVALQGDVHDETAGMAIDFFDGAL
jgi:predicted dienelactone hydrolase